MACYWRHNNLQLPKLLKSQFEFIRITDIESGKRTDPLNSYILFEHWKAETFRCDSLTNDSRRIWRRCDSLTKTCIDDRQKGRKPEATKGKPTAHDSVSRFGNGLHSRMKTSPAIQQGCSPMLRLAMASLHMFLKPIWNLVKTVNRKLFWNTQQWTMLMFIEPRRRITNLGPSLENASLASYPL